MRKTRFYPLLLASLLVAGLLVVFNYAGSYAAIEVTDGPKASPPASPRLIVELQTPPLAQAYKTMAGAAAMDGTLNLQTASAQAYISQLQSEQAAFVGSLQAAMPDVTVGTFINETGAAEQATYQVVLNGLAIDVGTRDRESARRQILRMPGVKAVYLDVPYETQLYTSTHLIGATSVWDSPPIGGVENAGAGIRFASMDGGVHKDAPMFSGEGYTYPPGYQPNGLGLTANNNGKIIASRVYFRSWDPPAPGDENPWPGERGTSHGVHTASTAAGNCVDNASYAGLPIGRLCGVAPRAYVMSYRMFYWSVNGIESFYTAEGIAALEDIVADGAQVLNNSWGAGPLSVGGEFDALDTALINASNAGVFVSMSNGNAGPGLGTGDHPSADYINVAATTTSGTLAAGTLGIAGPGDVPDTHRDFEYGDASFGAPLPIGVTEVYSYVPASAVDPGNTTGCSAFPANAFAGKAAVISRGSCEFGVKVLNAEQAGAVFAVIYNNQGEDILSMGPGAVGDQVTISSVFVSQSSGEKLLDWYGDFLDGSTLEFNAIAFQAGSVADRVIGFSSRGPAVGNGLKPDVAAPGVNILAQGYTPGATDEARHLGYGQASGTSMASPHVAGSAILLRQIHPTWSNADIKSALMSTAKYLEVYTVDGAPAQPLDIGAGRIDVSRAVNPGVILDPPSLGYGLVVSGGTPVSITVSVRSVASAAETYNISTLYTGGGFTTTTALPGFSVSPATLTLNPGETKEVVVTFDSAQGNGIGDNQGYIVLDGATYDAHLPAWARVTHETPLADVLIIDNDFSSELGYPDYLSFYTDALNDLGMSYQVVDTAGGIGSATTIPDTATLLGYDAIIYFTGDNYNSDGTFTVSTGLTTEDMDRLVEYLNNGGKLIAMGQDLASVLGSATTDSAGHVLYGSRLGANFVQDSLTDFGVPTAYVLPSSTAPEVFQDVIVDLTQALLYGDFGRELTGAEETPPVTSDLEGAFDVIYDASVNAFEFEVAVSAVVTTTPVTVTAAHIHHGAPGEAGPVVRSLDLGSVLPVVLMTDTLTLSGVITDLATAEVDALLAGNIYINVHTSAHPAGDVRGQISLLPYAAQLYMDEVHHEALDGSEDPDPNSPDNRSSIPFLNYQGPFNQVDGTVGLLNSDQPTLERPGTTYDGRTVYTTFGLEGVYEGGPGTSRAGLLGLFLDWASAEATTPVITVSGAVTESATVFFTVEEPVAPTAQASAVEQAQAALYRWDFGDGSAFVTSPSDTVGHTYLCAEDNTYTVRVETTDEYGNTAIGELEFDASVACFTEPPILRNLNLPWISNDVD